MSAKHDRDLIDNGNKQPCCGVSVFVPNVEERGEEGWTICAKQPAVDLGDLHLIDFGTEKYGAKGEQRCRYICPGHKDQGRIIRKTPLRGQ